MNGRAPNSSLTGSHFDVTKKLKPNFLIAIEDPLNNCQPTRKISTKTRSAISKVSHSKALSPSFDGRDILRSTSPDTTVFMTFSFIFGTGSYRRFVKSSCWKQSI